MTTNGAMPVIEVNHLTRRFRRKTAIDDVSFSVPKGCVFGLLGENGAGKTTLIKHLMGALKAKVGTVRVLGMDPVAQPVDVLRRVGYLSEDRVMPHWMRIHELMRFMEPFYPTWDRAYAEELREMFALDPKAKVKHLSRGERAKAGLLVALAHKPEVLILDEPSSGLDVIVRRDILTAIVRSVADEGRTVFFSSHLLDEVERVSDHIAMMAHGKLILCDTLDNVKTSHQRFTIRFETAHAQPPRIEGAFVSQGLEKEWTIVSAGGVDAVRHSLLEANATVIEEQLASLEDIFIARAKGSAVKDE